MTDFSRVARGDYPLIELHELYESPGFECVEVFRYAFPTPAGERWARVIHDRRVSPNPALLAQVERGMRQSTRAMQALGDFQIADVTVLIHRDGPIEGVPAQREEALRHTARGATSLSLNSTMPECPIAIYPFRIGADVEFAATVMGHELFHCIQHLLRPDMAFEEATESQAWWRESSATAFAAYAVSNNFRYSNEGERFDESIEAGLALDAMTYEAVPFFAWLIHRHGIGNLLPFLRLMSVGDVSEQASALAAALPDDDWRDFAQSVSVPAIKHPEGQLIPMNPDAGPTIRFERSGIHEQEGYGFQNYRGWMEFECGRWEIETSADEVMVSISENGTAAWEPMPDEIDVGPRGQSKRYRFAIFLPRDLAIDFQLKADRIEGCQGCQGIENTGKCLPGGWFAIGGGAVEWMKNQGVPITNFSMGPGQFVLRDDGTFVALPVGAAIQTETQHASSHLTGASVLSGGSWSADGNGLNMCSEGSVVSGRGTMTTPTGTYPVSALTMGSADLTYAYECNEAMLNMSLPMAGAPPITYQFVRTTPPPENIRRESGQPRPPRLGPLAPPQ